MLTVIDLETFFDGGPAARETVAQEIAEASESVGFFYIRNHRVPQGTIERALAAVQAYFALPDEEKRKQSRPSGHYRGYIPVMPFSTDARGGPPVLYEAFITGTEIGPSDPAIANTGGMLFPNLWPAVPEDFRPALISYWDAVTALSTELLKAFSLALAQDETMLLRYFRKPLSNMSLLHYLPWPRPEDAGADDTRSHDDTNAVTILLPGQPGGLEVLERGTDWIEAPPRPGCFVVNIGNMMESWSGDRFRSTKHRVHPPRDSHRYSLAYFASPDYETSVEPLPGVVPESGAKSYPALHAGREFAAFVAQFDKPEMAEAQ